MRWNLRKTEIKNLKKENETTRRLNRILWNHLTVNADEQVDFQFVNVPKRSNFIATRYLWNHWVSSIPGMFYLN